MKATRTRNVFAGDIPSCSKRRRVHVVGRRATWPLSRRGYGTRASSPADRCESSDDGRPLAIRRPPRMPASATHVGVMDRRAPAHGHQRRRRLRVERGSRRGAASGPSPVGDRWLAAAVEPLRTSAGQSRVLSSAAATHDGRPIRAIGLRCAARTVPVAVWETATWPRRVETPSGSAVSLRRAARASCRTNAARSRRQPGWVALPGRRVARPNASVDIRTAGREWPTGSRQCRTHRRARDASAVA